MSISRCLFDAWAEARMDRNHLSGGSAMLPIVSTVVVALVAALVIRVITRPDSMKIERSAVIDAPPERVYSLLVNFRQWKRWSPWEELDPAMERTFSGAEQGKGSVYAWSGNRKAGEGRMEIITAEPPHHLRLHIVFLKPFKAENTIDFTLTPQNGETQVRWSMEGQNTLGSKVMQSVVNMDRLVGRDFERGLANLRTEAESSHPAGTSPI